MKIKERLWLNISLVNLLIVAALGIVMRYKIGFEFPYFDQKNLQHAHSHFAFIGWVTHTLFVLMTGLLQQDMPQLKTGKYKTLITINLVCAYGMLFSFALQGYSIISITLSTLSIFTAYAYAFFFFRDLKKAPPLPYKNWFRGALWFNILASAGTFSLAIMMATHNFNQKIHLASIYYYLHFQYNGFFFFACMGLFVTMLTRTVHNYNHNKRVFWIFFLSCFPAYFLSVLWVKMPVWVFVLVILSAIAQVYAWFVFLKNVRPVWKNVSVVTQLGRYLFLIIVIALSVKFLLQLGSTIPAISKLAFGFRPIIIAYLHLVLLAIISVFLVVYMYTFRMLAVNKLALSGMIVFVFGVYFNELVLGLQGIASFSYNLIPLANEMLFGASVIIFISLVMLLISQRKKGMAVK